MKCERRAERLPRHSGGHKSNRLTSLKTISARIRGSRTELSELGESVDDLADGFSKYAEELKQLTGFDIMKEGTTNAFKDLYDIFDGLSQVWDKLSDTQQARVSEILGGTRQLQVVSSILGNWKDAAGAYADAMSSAGVATAANDKYMETAAAKIQQLKASFQEFASVLVNSSTISAVVSIVNALMQVVTWLTRLNGLLPATILLYKAYDTVKKSVRITNIANQALATKDLASNAALTTSVAGLTMQEKLLLKAQLERAAASGIVDAKTASQIMETLGLAAAEGVATGATNTLSVSFKGLIAAMGPLGWASLILSIVIPAATALFNTFQEGQRTVEEVRQEFDDLVSSAGQIGSNLQQLQSQASSIIPRFAELAKGVNEFGKNTGLTDDEYAEFISLNNQIAEMFPRINMGLDDNGNYMLALSYTADTLADSLWALVEAERAQADIELSKQLPQMMTDLFGKDGNSWGSISWDYGNQIDELENLISLVEGLINGGSTFLDALFPDGVAKSDLMSKADAEQAFKPIEEIFDLLGVEYEKQILESTNGLYQKVIRITNGLVFDDTKLNLANGLIAGYHRQIDQLKAELGVEVKRANQGFLAWLRSSSNFFTGLPDGLQSIVETMVGNLDISTIVSDAIANGDTRSPEEIVERYIENSIVIPLYTALNTVGADGQKAVQETFDHLFDLRDQLAKGKISEEYFKSAVTEAFNSLFGAVDEGSVDQLKAIFVSTFNAAGIAGEDFDAVLNNIVNEWARVGTASRSGSGALSSAAKNFGEAAKEFKSNFDLLAKAKKEMEDGGGLSVETIQALASANENYIDYLYEENGLIKLNTSAWQEFAASGIVKKIEELRAAIAFLNAELENNPDDIDGINTEIEENQRLLLLYEAILKSITTEVEGTSILPDLSAFNTFVNDVSSALGKVADLQDAVSNGFVISLEKAREFAEVYPEILAGAQITADGQIQLSEETVNAFIASKESEKRAAIDTEIQELTAKRESHEAYLALMEAQLQAAQSKDVATLAASNALVKALIDNGVEEVKAYEVGCAAMAGDTSQLAEIIMQACIDSDHNINQAAYNAAMGVVNNSAAMRGALLGIIDRAHNAALAVSGIASGELRGSTNDHIHGAVYDIDGDGQPDQYDPHPRLNTGGGYTFDGLGFTGYSYEYTPDLANLEDYINRLNIDIEQYRNAINQIDGQIALLRALRERELELFASGNGGGSGSSGGGYNSHDNTGENWFSAEYKLHQHLRNMEMETDEEYFDWLNHAYQEAYEQGIISLEDYMKYQEEVFNGLKELFKDYLNDIEFQIDLLSRSEGNNARIVELYREMIAAIERELEAAYARGLTENDDYIQELLRQLWQYQDAVEQFQEDIEKGAKDSLDKLVQLRVDMIKDEIKREREALQDRLSYLKDFYQKQKDMLREQYDEEKYLSEQQKKRRKIADLQAELERLRYDDSAWAQKRRLELMQELADAQEELNDFEHEHAIQQAQDYLDELYQQQEDEINSEIELLNQREQDSVALYQQALEDIRNGSIELYEEMMAWNLRYGDGIEDTIKNAWEEAYRALQAYLDLYGSAFEGVNLGNYTGYTPSNPGGTPGNGGNSSGSNDTGRVSGESAGNTGGPYVGDTVRIKDSATNYSPRSNGVHMAYFVPGGEFTVYRVEDDEILVGRDGVYTGWVYKHDLVGYRNGTMFARPGFKRVNEVGAETIFTSSNGSTYRLFSGGEKVLNAKASDFLYNFATSGGLNILKVFDKMMSNSVVDGIKSGFGLFDVKMGDIIINGSTNEATVSEIRRAQRDALNDLLREFRVLKR